MKALTSPGTPANLSNVRTFELPNVQTLEPKEGDSVSTAGTKTRKKTASYRLSAWLKTAVEMEAPRHNLKPYEYVERVLAANIPKPIEREAKKLTA